MPLEICKTDDNSNTLYVPELDEHYHSVRGALTESRHVYIDCGLKHRAAQEHGRRLSVFEVGLGTGLNALLTAISGIAVDYTAIEKYPLTPDIPALMFVDCNMDITLLSAIHAVPTGNTTVLTPRFNFTKIIDDFTTFQPTGKFDVIYMDAFAPEKQPEMWSEGVLSKLASMLNPDGVITTYSAKGNVRRTFEALGLMAERLPGPPGGKREILRLTKKSV